jgi:hypothetical protein
VGIGFQENFGIALGGESDAAFLELSPNLSKVVNFSVVDDPVAGLRIVHRLMPKSRKVEDREPAVSQSDLVFGITNNNRARIIRASVSKRLCAALEQSLRDTRTTRGDTEDSTHQVMARLELFNVTSRDIRIHHLPQDQLPRADWSGS